MVSGSFLVGLWSLFVAIFQLLTHRKMWIRLCVHLCSYVKVVYGPQNCTVFIYTHWKLIIRVTVV